MLLHYTLVLIIGIIVCHYYQSSNCVLSSGRLSGHVLNLIKNVRLSQGLPLPLRAVFQVWHVFSSSASSPQYWRACPSRPALLNAAHVSSVKPTSVTTPTASPSPLMPRLTRFLSYAFWIPHPPSQPTTTTSMCMQHDFCHPTPPSTMTTDD